MSISNIPNDNQEETTTTIKDCDDTHSKMDIIFVPDVSSSIKHATSLQIRSGNDDKERQSDDENDILKQGRTTCSRTFQLSLTSNILFVVASIFYLYLSVMDLNYAHALISAQSSNSGEMTTAGDDSYGSDDDAYGTAAASDDDDAWVYVFATNSGTWVSLYQIIYFLAALFFVLSGVVDFLLKPGFLSVTLTLAGVFGVVSAMLMEEYEYLSNVFNSVSVHLFMVEAFGLFLHPHRKTTCTAAAASKQQQNKRFLQRFVQLGSLSWIGGTLIDVILSYFSFFGRTGDDTSTMPFAIVGTLSSTLWLTCSLIYLTATCIAECQVRKQQPQQAEGAASATTTTIKAAETMSASSTSENDEKEADTVYVEV